MAVRRGGSTTFRECRPWVAGYPLWQEAQRAQVGMPVLLGDAVDGGRLLYWGVLTRVHVKRGGTGEYNRLPYRGRLIPIKPADAATFTVDRVRQFSQPHTPQELVLRGSGKHIAPGFTGPYAICRTPDFVSE